MTTWFHTMILATCAMATIAVGIASAAVYRDIPAPAAKKADRLSLSADATPMAEITIEHRSNGVSILTRVPAPLTP